MFQSLIRFGRQVGFIVALVLSVSTAASAEDITGILDTPEAQLTFSRDGQFSLLISRNGSQEKDYLLIMDTNDVQEIASGVTEAVLILQNTDVSRKTYEPILLRTLPIGKVSVTAKKALGGVKTVVLKFEDPFHEQPIIVSVPLAESRDSKSIMAFFNGATSPDTWGTRYAIPWKPHRWHP